jgi:hypothetical protein
MATPLEKTKLKLKMARIKIFTVGNPYTHLGLMSHTTFRPTLSGATFPLIHHVASEYIIQLAENGKSSVVSVYLCVQRGGSSSL